MTPLFSIVIPTFNRADLVGYAIESVLRQSLQDFEIIVSDNCSTDGTAKEIERFSDPRVRYVRTPRHFVIAASWEFARSQAKGAMVMMLADDDALVSTALERFAAEAGRWESEFLSCAMVEYRDSRFPGPLRNTVECPPFRGKARWVGVGEFVGHLFAFWPEVNMHPSGFVFRRSLAESIAERVGRFFQTNGVEYCAWPLAAVTARRTVYIGAPLLIIGRTGKSGGSINVLGNPGRAQIEEYIADVDPRRQYAPLKNFTFINLIAEGVLTAKHLLPKEFEFFEVDEEQYLRSTWWELRRRENLGVDVTTEIDDLLRYAARYPTLVKEFTATSALRRARRMVANLGMREARDWVRAHLDARRVRRGDVRTGFRVFGDEFGVHDILSCAEFIGRIIRGWDIAGRTPDKG